MSPAQSIKRLTDNAFIPFDPANTDYQAYLAWLEEDNEPLPANEPAPPEEPATVAWPCSRSAFASGSGPSHVLGFLMAGPLARARYSAWVQITVLHWWIQPRSLL